MCVRFWLLHFRTTVAVRVKMVHTGLWDTGIFKCCYRWSQLVTVGTSRKVEIDEPDFSRADCRF